MHSIARFIAMTALLTIPVPLLVGGGQVSGYAMYIFMVLSLVVPFYLQSAKSFRNSMTFTLHKGYYLYSWAFWIVFTMLGLFVISGNASGETPNFADQATLAVKNVATLVLFITVTFLTMIGLQKWFNLSWKGIVKDILNVSLYMLPIPMLILGALLYTDLTNLLIRNAYSSAILQMVYLDVYLLIIFAMVTFSLYFFPKAQVEAKAIRLVRILVTAFSWLMANVLILFSAPSPELADVLNRIVPAFEGNILVFFTPPLFEIPIIAIAIYMGIVAEKMLLAGKKKFLDSRTKK